MIKLIDLTGGGAASIQVRADLETVVTGTSGVDQRNGKGVKEVEMKWVQSFNTNTSCLKQVSKRKVRGATPP